MYDAASSRYDNMTYRRCGSSGLKLPAVSLGLWHNFGGVDTLENAREMLLGAFDIGVTHFDLANNYGPPPGSAEATFGTILKQDLASYRDELIISSKAGYLMWPGPYGEWGSRKYLVASLDQSLKRMGLEYVDIFYHHRPDPDTPLEETMQALDYIVRSGRALYVGISSYRAEQTREAAAILRALGTPCLIHQPSYSMFNRWTEDDGLYDALADVGMGSIVFSPLAQGMLTNKYLKGIPGDSRAAKPHGFLKKEALTEGKLAQISQLNELASARGQTLAQMAIAWVLRQPQITSALIGASRLAQVQDCVGALDSLDFTTEELARIDAICGQ
jgi:L-glyceraldehyde 3-phosphate reductase